MLIRKSLFGILLLFLSFSLKAQHQPFEISGLVYDANTEEAIPGASVYLSGTTSGIQSGPDGAFRFTTRQTGGFKLVISSIGYQTQSIDVFAEADSSFNRIFYLQPKVTQLDEVVVSASNTEWRNNFEAFRSFFIGNDSFAQQVTFENPQVISFEDKYGGSILGVKSAAPLIVLNNALGYRIRVEFVSVRFNRKDNTGVYKMFVNYEELPGNDKTNAYWEKNRREAYLGSAMHFFRSFVNDRDKKEGFEILRDGGEIEPSEETDLLIYHYPGTWKKLQQSYHLMELTERQVIVGYNLRYTRTGRVMNEENVSYMTYGSNMPFFLINDDGVLFDPEQLQFVGMWARDRFSKQLPSNYQPGSD